MTMTPLPTLADYVQLLIDGHPNGQAILEERWKAGDATAQQLYLVFVTGKSAGARAALERQKLRMANVGRRRQPEDPPKEPVPTQKELLLIRRVAQGEKEGSRYHSQDFHRRTWASCQDKGWVDKHGADAAPGLRFTIYVTDRGRAALERMADRG